MRSSPGGAAECSPGWSGTRGAGEAKPGDTEAPYRVETRGAGDGSEHTAAGSATRSAGCSFHDSAVIPGFRSTRSAGCAPPGATFHRPSGANPPNLGRTLILGYHGATFHRPPGLIPQRVRKRRRNPGNGPNVWSASASEGFAASFAGARRREPLAKIAKYATNYAPRCALCGLCERFLWSSPAQTSEAVAPRPHLPLLGGRVRLLPEVDDTLCAKTGGAEMKQ